MATRMISGIASGMSACRLLDTESCSGFPGGVLVLDADENDAAIGIAQCGHRLGDVALVELLLDLQRPRLREEVRCLGVQHEVPDELVVDLAGGRGVKIPRGWHDRTLAPMSRKNVPFSCGLREVHRMATASGGSRRPEMSVPASTMLTA
jgi:hypothetical protein